MNKDLDADGPLFTVYGKDRKKICGPLLVFELRSLARTAEWKTGMFIRVTGPLTKEEKQNDSM